MGLVVTMFEVAARSRNFQRRLVGAGWQLCRVSNRRSQGALERAPPPPPSADGYLPMTAYYNTTAES